jgi:GNAT superfamily N-acetyltransferase
MTSRVECASLQSVELPEGLVVQQSCRPTPEVNRFFYTAVGGDWYWVDRLAWKYADWMAYLTRPGQETWIALLEGTPCGYYELDRPSSDAVEIAFFGLLPQFVGRGIGKYLLTHAIARAWDLGPNQVRVHTSSLDHPAALKNYLARGFGLDRVEEAWKELPEQPPGPWPGAERGRK